MLFLGERNQAQLATEKRVQFGESSRIEFGFPPLLETDSPVEIQFAIEGVETPGKRILTVRAMARIIFRKIFWSC